MTRAGIAAGVISMVVAVAGERQASACGGCLSPPGEVTAVDGHRMVIALKTTETVLWDQIVYHGAPQDFAWVLPVPTSTVKIELASEAFFTELDAGTAPTIVPASPPPCSAAYAAECGGCGGGGAAGDQGDWGSGDGVTVFDHDVVGPYETVTIGSEDPDALYAWLDLRGYAVPESAVPALQHYIDLHSVFVVLRLAPGEGVDAMQPVRVRYPGYMATFPLEMVVIGASGVLDLALWVIAEQRYQARNYGTVAVDTGQLAWDWQANRSNYQELFDAAVLAGGNRAWVVEHASPLADISFGDDAGTDPVLANASLPYAYVTRLRTRVLVDHVDQDLELAPAADASDVSSSLVATIDVNYECPGATAAAGPPCSAGGHGAIPAPGSLLLGLAVAFALRRRR